MTDKVKRLIVIVLVGVVCGTCFGENGKGKDATSVFIATDLHEQDSILINLLGRVLGDKEAVVPSVVLLGGDYVGGSNRPGRGVGSAKSDSLRHHAGHEGMERPSREGGHGSSHEGGHGSSHEGGHGSSHDGGGAHPSHGGGHGSSHNSNPAFAVGKIRHEIDSVMSGHPCTSLFTYGSHDIAATEGYDAFFSGPYATDDYYLYGVSYAQMIYDTADSTYKGIDKADKYGYCAETATENFTKWVSTVTDDKPIIVMSHVPMHAARNDNQGGERWYQTLAKAAEKHRILLLFGHNHTVEDGGKTSDRQKYLLVPGDSIVTQGTVDRSAGTSNTYGHALNFYYGNAGYIKNGYATLITIGPDGMVIKRYSSDGNNPDRIGDTEKGNPYRVAF